MLIRILFSILFPLLTMTMIFAGRARRDSLFLVIGLLVAEVSAYVNGALGTLPVSFSYAVGNLSPVVEEILKGLPILVYSFGWKPTRRDLLEAGLSLGIGFAIIENTVYMVGYTEKITLLAALFRGIGAGMMHGITTMAVGFGMSFILLKRKLFVTGTLTFLFMAITYHSIYNMLVQSEYQLFGFLIPILTFSGFFAFYRLHKDRIIDATAN